MSHSKFQLPFFTKQTKRRGNSTFVENLNGNSRGKHKNKEIQNISYPITPIECLKYFRDCIPPFERDEMLAYKEIWHFGLNSAKFNSLQYEQQIFDDDQGFYVKIEKDHLMYRYEIIEEIGKGTFGIVLKCYDHKLNTLVAVKILRNRKKYKKVSLNEIEMLKYIENNDHYKCSHTVKMIDYFYFRKHMCIILELMRENLYDALVRRNFEGFSVQEIKHFTVGILKCLKFIHSASIIHCDLKPENILIKSNIGRTCRVTDFGSSCFKENKLYTYIQSRYYRAPEVILGIPYSPAIDMWSLGCIMVELFTGQPLFAGKNEMDQLLCIIVLLSYPPAFLVEQGMKRHVYFDKSGKLRTTGKSSCKPGSTSLYKIMKTNDDKFIDFIYQCLEWNPPDRLTAEEGLKHEWIFDKNDKFRLFHRNKRSLFEKVVFPQI